MVLTADFSGEAKASFSSMALTAFSTICKSRSTPQTIRWSYTTLRLGLLFQDLTGFGRFELTPGSRADYQQVLARVRRSQ